MKTTKPCLKKAKNRSEPKLPMKKHDERIHHPCTKLSRAQRAVPSSACSPSMESAGTLKRAMHASADRCWIPLEWSHGCSRAVSPHLTPKRLEFCLLSPNAVPNSCQPTLAYGVLGKKNWRHWALNPQKQLTTKSKPLSQSPMFKATWVFKMSSVLP